jgi:hypothetical protein
MRYAFPHTSHSSSWKWLAIQGLYAATRQVFDFLLKFVQMVEQEAGKADGFYAGMCRRALFLLLALVEIC